LRDLGAFWEAKPTKTPSGDGNGSPSDIVVGRKETSDEAVIKPLLGAV